MPRVLLIAPPALLSHLDGTVLSRGGIERVFAPTPEQGMRTLEAAPPDLVILGDEDRAATLGMIRRIRDDPRLRSVSLAIVREEVSLADEQELRGAGANVVLGGEAGPQVWDKRIEELLSVPRRRETRVPVRFAVWSHAGPDAESAEGTSVNVSRSGMLLDTDAPLDLGARLDVWFQLPGDPVEVRAMGQVVRDEILSGRSRYGIELLVVRGDGRERLQAFVDRSES